MLVVLRIISSAGPARHVQIRSDQVLRVGRSGWADLTVPGDARLLDIHFSVRCESRGCIVESLESSGPTLVNGEPVTQSVVYNGDVIEAGSTKFQVSIEGGPPRPSDIEPPPEAVDSPAVVAAATTAAMGLVGICVYLELSEDIQPLASAAADGDELIEQLTEQKKFQDAIRLRSHLLEKRQAVWWGCVCLREDVSAELPEDQLASISAAELWVKDPSESHRRSSEKAAADIKYAGPGGTLALSAFWSDGSLAPEGSEDVPPDERLTSQGVTASLVMAAYLGDPTKSEGRFTDFLAKGKSIADGSIPLPSSES